MGNYLIFYLLKVFKIIAIFLMVVYNYCEQTILKG